MKKCLAVGMALFVALCCGCGPGVGEVSGIVTFQGAPLPGGTVTFRPADGSQNSVAYVLKDDGEFRVTLPAGEVAVCVDNRDLEPLEPTIPPDLSGVKLPPDIAKQVNQAAEKSNGQTVRESSRYRKIPEKYYTVETSGLKIVVKPGEQSIDLDLKE